MASVPQLSKVLQTTCGFRQWSAAMRPVRADGSRPRRHAANFLRKQPCGRAALAQRGLHRQYNIVANFITHGGCSDFAIPRRHQFDRRRVGSDSTLTALFLAATILTSMTGFFSASFRLRSTASNRGFVARIARSRGDCVLHVSVGRSVALGLRNHRYVCTLSECFQWVLFKPSTSCRSCILWRRRNRSSRFLLHTSWCLRLS
jgi:hypothetical protein